MSENVASENVASENVASGKVEHRVSPNICKLKRMSSFQTSASQHWSSRDYEFRNNYDPVVVVPDAVLGNTRSIRRLAAVITFVLFAAACSSGTSTTDEDPTETANTQTTTVDTGAGDPNSDTPSDDDATVELFEALNRSVESTAWRAMLWSAETFEIPHYGISESVKIGEVPPDIVAEVTPDAQHYVLDFSDTTEYDGTGGRPTFQIWGDDERVTVDTTRLPYYDDFDPDDLLAPGVFFVERAEINAGGFMDALYGAGASLALNDIAETLATSRVVAERTAEQPLAFTATIPTSELGGLFGLGTGTELERSTITYGICTDPEPWDDTERAEAFADIYDTLETVITFEFHGDGLLSALTVFSDLSTLSRVFGHLDENCRPEYLRDMFADATFTRTIRIAYEHDEGLMPAPAPETEENRTTDDWFDDLSALRSS